jgi:GNAT superfamily N-acetyltransferase
LPWQVNLASRKLETTMLQLQLQELVQPKPNEAREFADFVNRHYSSPFPLAAESVLLPGANHYFWAVDATTGERVGATGYFQKTPFLCETIKTVVARERRGQGLGVLPQAIEDEVARRGFTKVMTTIYVDNLPMIFLKLKQGYRFEGFHPDHERPGLAEYSLGKVLPGRIRTSP